MNFKHLSRYTVDQFCKAFDNETKHYCLNECLDHWDKKHNFLYQPYGLVSNNELLSLIFYSIKQHDDVRISYVERCFTPVKHRGKGYFTLLLDQFCSLSIKLGCSYVQLFCDKAAWPVYEKYGFKPLFETKDKKYYFVLHELTQVKNINDYVELQRETY